LSQQIIALLEPIHQAQFEAMAEIWRPWRTWVAVLLRAAGPRVLSNATPPSSATPRSSSTTSI